ncbi:uncharacterized protein LOC119069518 [Bradysia coprophila]|uniref:uncharacterized protein LOC119069518 n=1 Tax=Bradysia coprophila TaxID=38358 RepID=UPI00187DD3C0|nr:uncharacterized protein LOC119069518 [Bradysia coprophila]XP_037029492.1 uncharacterized protein LOC119069518 [Bradysia coprophila]
MSEGGINWYTIIYPAVAIPILVLAVVRWNILRKRQLQRAQQITQNYNNGFTAQDFVAGNPFDTTHQAAVYNIEQSAANDNSQNTTGFGNQQPAKTHQGTSSNDPPPPYAEATKYAKKKPETPVDEPKSMIQSRRWF